MQLFTLIDTQQSLTLTSTSNEISVPISRNDTLATSVLNANMCAAIVTTLVTVTAPEIGVYKGATATASNKIGRIRIGSNRFAVGNIVLGENIATPSASATSPLGYGAAFEPVTGAFDDTTTPIFKVDTAATAGVAKILIAAALREGA